MFGNVQSADIHVPDIRKFVTETIDGERTKQHVRFLLERREVSGKKMGRRAPTLVEVSAPPSR